MKDVELSDLIFKIANYQDKKAFNDIFHYFAPKIMGYIVGTGSKKEMAEEITQEVMTTIWQKAYQYNNKKAKLSTWIFTTARNKRIDRLRKYQKPKFNDQDIMDSLYQDETPSNQEIEERIEQIQSKLDINERKLIKMNFFEGKSHKNMSEELEIPIGTVKSRIRNILKKMQE